MGDCNAQIGKITNPIEKVADKFVIECRNEKGDTLV